MKTTRIYKGFHLENTLSGWWTTFSCETGYLRADTLQGLKKLIRERGAK